MPPSTQETGCGKQYRAATNKSSRRYASVLLGATLAATGVSCSKPSDDDAADLCTFASASFQAACSIPVEFVALRREHLHGKQIELIGYLGFQFGFFGIYGNKDHFELGLSNVAVRIETPADEEALQALVELNNKPVRLVGHFINNGQSAVPMWAGSVQIESLSELPPRIETDPIPLYR